MGDFLDRAEAAVGDDGRLPLGSMPDWDVFPFEREGLRARPLSDYADPEPDRRKDPADCRTCQALERASQVFHEAVDQVVAPYGVEVEVRHQRGVPPVENDERAVAVLEAAARDVLGEESVLLTEQSLGGEDFAWYLTKVPGAMARLGPRTPGGRTYDIHQGDLVVDEQAIAAGASLLARAVLRVGAGSGA